MADVHLTCEETPLAWPANVDPADINVCTTCALTLSSYAAGSLQILTRRQGAGVGDGVNIEESGTVGADYRGQRYNLDELIFHVPGLHIFPGQSAVYPGEIHVHMETITQPKRYLVLVIPVSHRESGPGTDWFAATAAQPDPQRWKPQLSSLLTPGARVLTYMGMDLRGRTAETPLPAGCASRDERQYLLVMAPANIRATDLERIPREGSLSTDPRDLPARNIAPSKRLPRDRLLQTMVMAVPGIAAPPSQGVPVQEQTREFECKPIRVQDGRDVVDMREGFADLAVVMGYKKDPSASAADAAAASSAATNQALQGIGIGLYILLFFMVWFLTFLGLFLADRFFLQIWRACFNDLRESSVIKLIVNILLSASMAGISLFYVE